MNQETLSEEAAITAIEGNLVQLVLHSGSWPSCVVHSENAIACTTSIPLAFFNQVLRAEFTENIDDSIEATIDRFRTRNVPFNWFVGPQTCPGDLGAHLQRHGLSHIHSTPGMAVVLASLNQGNSSPIADFRVESVSDRERLAEWLAIWAEVFSGSDRMTAEFGSLVSHVSGNHPCFAFYVGYFEEKPVSIAMSVIGEERNVGIYNVATLERMRGKGLGRAITLRALTDAQSKGCQIGTLTSSPLGLGIYQSLGFEQYCSMDIYTWSSPAEKS